MQVPHHTQDHLISLSRFTTSAERAIGRGIAVFGDLPRGRLVPIIIGLNITRCGAHHDGLILEFLRKLAHHQSPHFVRFMCHADWAVRAGVINHFYTDVHDLDQKADIIWTISVTGTSQIGLDITITSPPEEQHFLSTLSADLKQNIQCTSQLADQLCHMMKYLPFHLPSLHHSHCLSQLHILMIPKRDDQSFMFVPLRTMTAKDAYYRFHRLEEHWRTQHHHHYEIFTHQLSLGDHLHSLMDLIGDSEGYGQDPSVTQEIYGLAELLFSIYIAHDRNHLVRHNVILFQTNRNMRSDLMTYHLAVDDMHKKSV